jgi:colicin import membrane protein
MWKAVRENPRAVTYAVLMHLGLLLLLVFSLDWTPKISAPAKPQAIQAELVDSTRLKAIEEQKRTEQRKLQAAKEQAVREKQQAAEAQRKAEAAQKLKVEQEVKRKAEAERKQKTAAEAKRKAEAERKQKAAAEAKRKAEAERKQQAEAEAKRKAEAERKQKAAAEAKRKAEQEKAAAEAARQREAEAALQAQIKAEQELARAKSALAEYIPYIQQKVQRNWLRPAGSPAGLSCLVEVRLIPGGEVASVQVIRSSGDPLFDDSVEKAVLKASPLPLPTDASLFNHFREINFNFSPG